MPRMLGSVWTGTRRARRIDAEAEHQGWLSARQPDGQAALKRPVIRDRAATYFTRMSFLTDFTPLTPACRLQPPW